MAIKFAAYDVEEQLSDILGEVRDGNTVQITYKGETVGILRPAEYQGQPVKPTKRKPSPVALLLGERHGCGCDCGMCDCGCECGCNGCKQIWDG